MCSTPTTRPNLAQDAQARDARAARALKIRISDIDEEMASCVRLTDALFDEFVELSDTRHQLVMALRCIEDRLAANTELNGAPA